MSNVASADIQSGIDTRGSKLHGGYPAIFDEISGSNDLGIEVDANSTFIDHLDFSHTVGPVPLNEFDWILATGEVDSRTLTSDTLTLELCRSF